MAQDEHEVAQLFRALETASKGKRKGEFAVKRTTFDAKGSPTGIKVDSWRLSDWDYKRPDLPVYARGLFTTKNNNTLEIAVRGYDKFFNTDEVSATKWENILKKTKGPYELTLKENGCIIFIAGLADDTLLVCSKHSTGDRQGQISHANAGEEWLEKQLSTIGKTKQDLARELRGRNATAVAELCDDNFEEHILAYGPEKAGLYLHGINFNVPEFATHDSAAVQTFAQEWGFRKTSFISMDNIEEVRKFLEEAALTGAYDGQDVEGFVIRCQMSPYPGSDPYRDWFFKYKFEEPYLMYRQWRECTKALINGKMPRYRTHIRITEEYINYTKRRLAKDPMMAKLYNQNHGIIALRNDFLVFKNLDGSAAANMADDEVQPMNDVMNNVVLCPIATIGCGKTTIALALKQLFDWGHVQNDDISGKGRPPRFVRAVLDALKDRPVVFADRNNAQRHERKQMIMDTRVENPSVKLVALYFQHNSEAMADIRALTRERIVKRGDNHQTIHAATDENKFMGVMDGFLERFEICNPTVRPDNGFDVVINLDPTVGSRKNLEVVINQLHSYFPSLIKAVPHENQFDAAFETALNYQPDFKQYITDRAVKTSRQAQASTGQPKKKKLEYVAVSVQTQLVHAMLESTFARCKPAVSRMFLQLKQTRRIQSSFHVTLMHRANEKQNPELWESYTALHLAAGGTDETLGKCTVLLERVSGHSICYFVKSRTEHRFR